MIKKYLALFVLLLFTPIIATAMTSWQIVPSKSSISFTATQNDAPATGEFKKFTGTINFDPEQLSSSNVTINVDVASIADPYNQLADTLKNADWFNTKLFPQAVFKSTNFTKTSDKTYQANGTLTLRNKTLPVTLIFTLDQYTNTDAHAKGSVTINRSAFGIGQGEWADTKVIKDLVVVNFTVTAVKK